MIVTILLVTGVGGTGVVTVGQLITMAAHLEGKGASVLDFMGFAQKFGPSTELHPDRFATERHQPGPHRASACRCPYRMRPRCQLVATGLDDLFTGPHACNRQYRRNGDR